MVFGVYTEAYEDNWEAFLSTYQDLTLIAIKHRHRTFECHSDLSLAERRLALPHYARLPGDGRRRGPQFPRRRVRERADRLLHPLPVLDHPAAAAALAVLHCHPCLVVGRGSRLQAQRRRGGADATRLLLEARCAAALAASDRLPSLLRDGVHLVWARLRHAHQEKWALTAETRPPTGPLS